jgi:hypothetical protein
MSKAERPARELLCPSARPDDGSLIFAVRTDHEGTAGVAYLDEPIPTSREVLALAGPVDPREVFRFASPCAQSKCVHFEGDSCALGGRVSALLPAVQERLPVCQIRSQCRWFAERGPAACQRCPLIVTKRAAPSDDYARVVLPADNV